MIRRASAFFASLLLAAPQVPSAVSAEKTPADLVLARSGALPILLTAPHGGRELIPEVKPRRAGGAARTWNGSNWGGLVVGADTRTDALAQRIALEIRKLTGKDPYLVVAKFQRKYIDPNRPPALAFDDAAARPYFDHYHQSIRRFVDEIRERYPAAILLDVHSQGKGPDVIMRGTRDGRTVLWLVRRHGFAAVTGPNGLFGQLEANGFKVFPGNDLPQRGTGEEARFRGGYTVFTYGGEDPRGIDAMQLEFGSRYLQEAVLDKSAKAAARAIVAFYEAYLKPTASR